MNTVRQFVLCLALLFSLAVGAQKPAPLAEKDADFKEGVKLFNKEKYAPAQERFRKVVARYSTEKNDLRTDAEFYNAMCAIELFNADAEQLITNFISQNPESPRVREAYFAMGCFKYRNNEWQQAVEWFDKVDISWLNNEEVAEYYFKKGYSHFSLSQFDKASNLFKEVKDSETKYSAPALYYYSHIEYQNKHYETALIGFEKLLQNETFAPVAPYYIAQIYYVQKKYEKVIEYAPKLLDSTLSAKRATEINRIIGESYYQLQKYPEALPYFEKYAQSNPTFTRDDYYSFGYLYYRLGKYEKSAEYLTKVVSENDTIAQNAYYHLADCYVRTDKKDAARNAFFAASKYDVDKTMKRDALFSYAKLTYELTLSPFNEAINAFQLYIDQYPSSDQIDEAYSYLAKAYLSAKNYKDALSSLDKIRNRNSEMNQAYQRAAFFRGLELFTNLDFENAIVLIDKSLFYGMFDKRLKALGYYWKAEAQYRQKKYIDATQNYESFIKLPGSLGNMEYTEAHYSLGYTNFNLHRYNPSIEWFRKYLDLTKPDTTSKQRGDACNRLGDCYFITKHYDVAVKFYEQAVNEGVIDGDYSVFQQAFCYGLMRRDDIKIARLKVLVQTYPESPFVDDALFEIAETYAGMEKNAESIPYYEKVANEYPNCSYVKKSLLQVGLIYYNMNENDKALEVYKKVVSDYPATPDSKNALVGIKNIYISKNDVSSYMKYVEGLGEFASVSAAGQDSLNYLAAEDAYMKADFDKAKSLFNAYNEKYPNGTFCLNANFYKADCNMHAKELDEALVCYEFIIARPKSMFTELSLLSAAQICSKKADYEKALKYYTQLESSAEMKSNLLEARIGQLHCNIKLKNNEQTISSAQKVLATDKVSEEQRREANFAMAQAYAAQADWENAMEKYRVVAADVKSSEGAQSKYLIIQLLYKQEKYDASETEILDFLDRNSPHQFWLGKTYLIWADIFEHRGDLFQAKQTLLSVIDNYPNQTDGIIETAKKRVATIEGKENAPATNTDKGMEVDFNKGENPELFNEKKQ